MSSSLTNLKSSGNATTLITIFEASVNKDGVRGMNVRVPNMRKEVNRTSLGPRYINISRS